ncbi:hypothetical protein ACJX0J_036928, partial [Zea mays]
MTVAPPGQLAHRTLSGAHWTVRCPLPAVGAGHASPADCAADRCAGDRWLTGQSGAPPDSPVNYSRQQLTGVAGSLAYLAPEVLLGNYSQKVDVWAVVVLLHVLLMGTLPFQGKSVEAIFDVIKTAELDFHSSQLASVSLLVHDLIGRMLNQEVSSRPDAED